MKTCVMQIEKWKNWHFTAMIPLNNSILLVTTIAVNSCYYKHLNQIQMYIEIANEILKKNRSQTRPASLKRGLKKKKPQ